MVMRELPWDENDTNNTYAKYIIINSDGEIIAGCETEPEAFKMAMIKGMVDKLDIEVYQRTGFAKFKSGVKRVSSRTEY